MKDAPPTRVPASFWGTPTGSTASSRAGIYAHRREARFGAVVPVGDGGLGGRGGYLATVADLS